MSAHFSPHGVSVLGSGSALPGEPVDNERMLAVLRACGGPGLARRARLLVRQLGVKSRHLSRDLEQIVSAPTPDAPGLCVMALRQAEREAGLPLDQLEYLIAHTASPHSLLPANVAWVAERLQFAPPYMELRQACTGFANALQIASAMLGSGSVRRATGIVGSEVGSVFFRMDNDFIDTEQLINYLQMGDGAGAVILAPGVDRAGAQISDIYTGHIGLDRQPGFYLEGGGSGSVVCDAGLPRFRHRSDTVRQQGGDLFVAGLEAIRSRGYSLDDFRYILPHQANGHLASLLAQHLGIEPERVVVDADRLGNMGSAAIWVSFDRLRKSGRLAPGDRVLVLGAEATKYMYGGFVYQH